MPASAPSLRTPGQNSTIWGLVSRLADLAGLDRDQIAIDVLRPLVQRVSGQEHSSRLTFGQAKTVIEQLQAEVGSYTTPTERKPWGPRGPGPREGQAITPRQQEILLALFEQAGLDTRERQMGFCKRQCDGMPWPQTQAHADALYAPLQAMVLRRLKPGEALRRAQALVGNSGLNSWQRQFIPDLAEQLSAGGKLSTHKLYKLIEAEVACAPEEKCTSI